jgi:3-hydroxyacyl-[acyl-carrier-protein] dehydratase
MRWFWIDKFTEFVCGEYAVGIKQVSLSEHHVCGNIPSMPAMPASLIIEGIAQTGGLLVSQQFDFEQKVVLAKIARANFDYFAGSGETLEYRTTIQRLTDDGGIVLGEASCNGKPLGSAEIVFAYLSTGFEHVRLFQPSELLEMLRSLGLFKVACHPDGTPLEIPQSLLVADTPVGK